MASRRGKIVSIEIKESEGARVKRLFPNPHLASIGPFILMDEFFLEPSAAFPTHSYEQCEVINYIHEGSLTHRDEAGNHVDVLQGSVQRLTAGLSREWSQKAGKSHINHGFQLWVGLPSGISDAGPAYQSVDAVRLPELSLDNVRIKTIVGGGSSLRLHTPVIYQLVQIIQTSTTISIPEEFAGFIYVYQGHLKAGADAIKAGEGLELGKEKDLTVQTESSAGFLYAAGNPGLK